VKTGEQAAKLRQSCGNVARSAERKKNPLVTGVYNPVISMRGINSGVNLIKHLQV